MNIATISSALPSVPCDLAGIAVFEDDLPRLPQTLLPTTGAEVAALLAQAVTEERFTGKIGQTLAYQTQGKIGARRVLLMGGGSLGRFQTADARHLAAVLSRTAASVGARSALFALPAHVGPSQLAAHLEAATEGLFLGRYRFDKYLTADKLTPVALAEAMLAVPPGLSADAARAAIERGTRVARAVGHARDLVNEPARAMTPSALAAAAETVAREVGLSWLVLGPDECRERGMGLFLGVAQGSSEPARFIHLSWRPPGARRRVVLVGKGVTFDSGGLSLKTTDGMLTMKSDMAGAAAVLSALPVIAEERLPIEVHALAACTENMPSGSAYKLGDVLRSLSGKTVEINNTDAEGRLTLADALTYASALQPDVVLDFATLTGACVVALGPHTAGVMSNHPATLDAWMAAAREAGEEMWPLPLPPRLLEQLKSDVADLRNTGERWGGALTAGLFLQEFVGTTPWIHVDLAGPAMADKEWGAFGKGGTGFAVSAIVHYLRRLSESVSG